jgi:hypothetical protein
MRGGLDAAVSSLGEGVARYPAAGVLLNNLAVAQEAGGDFESARHSIERSGPDGLCNASAVSKPR